MSRNSIFGLAAGIAILFSACQRERFVDDVATDSENQQRSVLSANTFDIGCPSTSYKLFNGEKADDANLVGNVTLSNDAQFLYVRYEISSPKYYLSKVQLWAGNDYTKVPSMYAGDPRYPDYSKFTYKEDNLSTSTTVYTFTVPLKEVVEDMKIFCEKPLYVYAHATLGPMPRYDVKEGEAWSYGTSFNGKIWGWYSEYKGCCSFNPPPAGYEDETAFAKIALMDNGYVFTSFSDKSNPEKYPSLSLSPNRWGWAGNLLFEKYNAYVAPIYASAARNDISKGTLVGYLYVKYYDDRVKVQYQMDVPYLLREVHVYLNRDKPTTIAPGQYGFAQYFNTPTSSYSNEFKLGEKQAWIIAHAVVGIPK